MSALDDMELFSGVLRSKATSGLPHATMRACSGHKQDEPPPANQSAYVWYAAVPKSDWPDDEDSRNEIRAQLTGPWGDRRQELVFIGAPLQESRIRNALDAALLTDAELLLGPEGWQDLEDPFPASSQPLAAEPQQAI